MDLALTQGQEMLRRSAREFLEAECPTTLVRELEVSDIGYSSELWGRMAGLGWLGLALPVEHGGEGGDLIDQLVLAEEVGRALLPSPLLTSSILCGQLILKAGNSSQLSRFLPNLAQGKTIMSLALSEANGDFNPGQVSAVAVTRDEGYAVSGAKTFVPYAASADFFICVARNGDSRGFSLALVEVNSPGVTVTPLKSIANFPQAQVELRDVTVPRENILGVAGSGGKSLLQALEWATLVQCGEMVGRTQKILEMAVDYSKSRIQFGRPIGTFQAIQHQCADLRVAVDVAQTLTYRAACSLIEGLPCSEEIAIAKAAADEVSRLSTVTGHGIYAGISYTVEHDMQLYSARNRLAEANLGNTAYHIDRIAGLMGL